MEKNRKDILCLIYVPFAMFFVAWAGHIAVSEFYRGAPFLAAMTYQTYFFFLFFARTLYTFGDFERYYHGYGVALLLRHKKKQRLFLAGVGQLLKKVLVFQVWALLCACLFSWLVLGNCEIFAWEFWRNVGLYCLADFAMALFQMLLETIWDGRIGILGAGLYDMLAILLSDRLYFLPDGKRWMWLFLSDLGNAEKMEECGYSAWMVLLILGLAICILMALGGAAIRRKDIL